MARYFKVRITQGFSNCPSGFNIYWDNFNNLAQVYNGAGQPLTPANNIPYNQLITQPTPFIVVVGDNVTRILLYDTCNQCQTLILSTP